MNKSVLLSIVTLLSILSLTGCNGFKAWVAENFMQDNVSDGAGRLVTQHASMIMFELSKEFDSPKAKVVIEPSSDAKEAGKGTVVWTIENIDIEHKDEVPVYSDCQGEQGLWQGKASIAKAKKTMYGRLTGDAKKPVIPDVGKLSIEVEATAHDLSIRFPSKEGHLKIIEGDISFTARPRLAQNETGMRLTPTSNTKFEKVRLQNVQGELRTKDVVMPVTINETDMDIQVGEGEDGAINEIAGSITIFGNRRNVPTDGRGLDPNFDAEKFRATYACHPELKGTISYSHIPMEQKLAHGTAALTAKMMVSIAGLLEQDDSCGLSSAEVIAQTTINGMPGEKGSTNASLRRPCMMVVKDLQSKPNCFGEAEVMSGRISVIAAQKTMQGIVVAQASDYKRSASSYAKALLAGDVDKATKLKPKAILPASNQPVELNLVVELNDIEIKPVCLSEGQRVHPSHCEQKKALSDQQPILRVKHGRVSSSIKPLLAKDLDEKSPTANFCAQKTRAGMISVDIEAMLASVERGGFIFSASSKGAYTAVNGQVLDKENELAGSLRINDVDVDFKTTDKGYVALDPNYERQAFLDSFMSCAKLGLVSDLQCRPEEGLAANVARLLVQNAGSIIKIAGSSVVENSFASPFAVKNRVLSQDNKTLILPASIDVAFDVGDVKYRSLNKSLDAFNNKTTMTGTIKSLHGTMVRHGVRTNEPVRLMGFNLNIFGNRYVEGFDAKLTNKKEIFVRPIVPNSTTITLESEVQHFSTHLIKDKSEHPEARIKLLSGLFKIEAMPFFGIDERTQHEDKPSYSIATPVVKFARLVIEHAPLILKAQGMTIPIFVQEAELQGHNGHFAGEGNYIQGALKMKIASDFSHERADGGPQIHIAKQDLLPEAFDQDRFDKSYAHTEFLLAPLKAD